VNSYWRNSGKKLRPLQDDDNTQILSFFRSMVLPKYISSFFLANSAEFHLDFPKSFPGPSMARFTSSVDRTFVTCSAPVTSFLHWRPKRLHYRSLSKEPKNNIIFSGFCWTNVYYWSKQSKQCNYNFVEHKNHVQHKHWNITLSIKYRV
jgi:hypothetical protein